MKILKVFLFLSFVSFSFAFVPQALAESTATSSSRPILKREGVKTRIEEKKGERIQKLSAIRKERIMNFSNKMIVRLEATIERIEKLIVRIEERITKIEEEKDDINLSSVKTSLIQIKSDLEEVKTKVTSLKESLDDMPEAENPKILFEEIREKLKEIKEDLKDIHGMLVKLIGDIKGLRVGDNKND